MPDVALLSALGQCGLALALVGDDDRIAWCTPAFAGALGQLSTADVLASPLRQWLGTALDTLASAAPGAAITLTLTDADGQPAPWRATWAPAGGHDPASTSRRLLSLQRLDDCAARAAALEERLELVQQFTSAGIFERDPATMQGHWDAHMYRIFGLPVPPAGTPAPTYAQIAAMIVPQDREPGSFSASMGRPGVHASRIRVQRPDGGTRHIHSQWKVFHDAQGRAVRVLGVNADDTEVFELAQRAQDAARQLEAAAEAARVGLWSTRVGEGLPNWNRRMFELFGLDPAEPAPRLGDLLRRCVHPEDRQRVAAQAIGWTRGNSAGAIEIEFRIVRPDDAQQRWLLVRGRTHDTPGDGRRLEGIAQDITEQHTLLRQLHDTVERAKLTRAALGLGSWEAEGEQRMVVWDEQMFRLRGADSPSRAITDDEVATFLHPQDRAAVMSSQLGRMRNGQPWSTEFRVVWPDGTVRWIASRSVPQFDEAGREQRRIGLNFDITDARLAEQAIRERELAQAESRAKSQFMARVSHELRTPLNAVLGFTQLLRGDTRGIDAETRDRWLAHIDEAGQHLLALIDDVLDLSRVAADEMQLDLQPVPLAALVRSTVPLLASAARAQDVRVAEDGDLPGVALADPVRLRQVLLNLLSNAIKYNRTGGEVRLSSAEGDGRVTLRVADSGLGIDPARLRQAFEPFNRLGAEASTIQGTGIGLAITKALVERMGGAIGIDSRAGEGSVFSIHLPAALSTQIAQPPPDLADDTAATPPSARSDGVARLLYIEDNPINAVLVRELLAKRPTLALEVAVDGASGIAMARANRPDLVMIDMQLPDMHGMEVLQALRSDPLTAAIPCVALSANAMIDDIRAARAAGFADYWTKPIDFVRLLADLGRVLGRSV